MSALYIYTMFYGKSYRRTRCVERCVATLCGNVVWVHSALCGTLCDGGAHGVAMFVVFCLEVHFGCDFTVSTVLLFPEHASSIQGYDSHMVVYSRRVRSHLVLRGYPDEKTILFRKMNVINSYEIDIVRKNQMNW
jgi:hypothetical protein